MTQPTTPDEEYGWLDTELSAFAKYVRHHEKTGLGGKNHQGVAKQQIISHTQQNYTPNSEVERVKREAELIQLNSLIAIHERAIKTSLETALYRARNDVLERLSNKENK